MNTTANADQQELDKFGEVAHRWWDPNSEFRPLHDINPARSVRRRHSSISIAPRPMLPFCKNCARSLRNMTHKDIALKEMNRVLKPNGKLLVLEFSKVAKPLSKIYDWYSFKILPQLGKFVAGDDASYRYLAESIRMHPSQEELKSIMKTAGFGHVDIHNMTGGVVALHVGIKC